MLVKVNAAIEMPVGRIPARIHGSPNAVSCDPHVKALFGSVVDMLPTILATDKTI